MQQNAPSISIHCPVAEDYRAFVTLMRQLLTPSTMTKPSCRAAPCHQTTMTTETWSIQIQQLPLDVAEFITGEKIGERMTRIVYSRTSVDICNASISIFILPARMLDCMFGVIQSKVNRTDPSAMNPHHQSQPANPPLQELCVHMGESRVKQIGKEQHMPIIQI